LLFADTRSVDLIDQRGEFPAIRRPDWNSVGVYRTGSRRPQPRTRCSGPEFETFHFGVVGVRFSDRDDDPVHDKRSFFDHWNDFDRKVFDHRRVFD
jgi:hypothetical protein